MKIGIVGAGALGALFGQRLSAANEVVLLERKRDVVDVIREHGLRVDGEARPARATSEPRELYGVQALFVFVRATDTLRALQSDADALKASAEALRAAKKSFDLAQQQRGLGTISVVALLNAEQAYRTAELSMVQAQANRYADTAGLFQAVGGGWWNRSEEPKYEPFSPSGK